jgi:hypothetical protein
MRALTIAPDDRYTDGNEDLSSSANVRAFAGSDRGLRPVLRESSLSEA